jgi:hypothetical protein
LVIITKGGITDFDITLDLIKKSGDKPLSILIIGVGNGDFTKIE